MKVATSYFTQIRNFKPNMIPISTACYEHPWYHDYKGKDHKFFNKRGILCGVRCPQFAPNKSCSNLCHGKDKCETADPTTCEFLKKYREQLDALNFEAVKNYLADMTEWAVENLHIPEEDVTLVFMVHEAYYNPCSERQVIIDYFTANGMPIKELDYPIT